MDLVEFTQLMAQHLELPEVKSEDNFIMIGGDSLTALTIAGQVELATGHRVPLQAFFVADTVADLWDRLAAVDA